MMFVQKIRYWARIWMDCERDRGEIELRNFLLKALKSPNKICVLNGIGDTLVDMGFLTPEQRGTIIRLSTRDEIVDVYIRYEYSDGYMDLFEWAASPDAISDSASSDDFLEKFWNHLDGDDRDGRYCFLLEL